VIAQRILAVLSAILLVGSVAIATLGPPGVPLGQAVFMLDHDLMDRVHRFIATNMTDWVWSELTVPLLLRPAWLVPASVGLICAGIAVSLSNRKPARRSPHRSQ
jgi:hypothetical protein